MVNRKVKLKKCALLLEKRDRERKGQKKLGPQ